MRRSFLRHLGIPRAIPPPLLPHRRVKEGGSRTTRERWASAGRVDRNARRSALVALRHPVRVGGRGAGVAADAHGGADRGLHRRRAVELDDGVFRTAEAQIALADPVGVDDAALAGPPTLSAVLRAVDTVGALFDCPRDGPPPRRRLLCPTALLFKDNAFADPPRPKAALPAFWKVGAELRCPAKAGTEGAETRSASAVAPARSETRIIMGSPFVCPGAPCPGSVATPP